MVWWPAAAEPINQGMRANLEGINTGPVFRSLLWKAWLGKPPTTTAPVLVGAEQPVAPRRVGLRRPAAESGGRAGRPGRRKSRPTVG